MDSTRIFLFWAIGADNAKIGCLFILWLTGSRNKLDGAGGQEASNFFNIGGMPKVAVTACAEGRIFGNEAGVRVEGIAMESKEQ